MNNRNNDPLFEKRTEETAGTASSQAVHSLPDHAVDPSLSVPTAAGTSLSALGIAAQEGPKVRPFPSRLERNCGSTARSSAWTAIPASSS